MSEVIRMRVQDVVGLPGGGGSDAIWLPSVDEDGDLSWSKSSTSTPPETVNIKGPAGAAGQDGADGADGRGITSIVKTATSANVDTYTITYTDGTTQTYTVTNGLNGTDGEDGSDGVGIASVSVNSSNHLIITKTDGTTQDAGEIQTGGTVAEYPQYAATERDLVYSTVRGYISTLDNPIIIGFNTDQHIIADATASGSVATRNEVTYGLKTLRDLTKVLPFNLVVLGGDTHGSSSGTIASMQNSALYVVSQMYGTNAPLASLTGNHEGGQDNQSITREQVLKSHMTFSMVL